MLKLKAKVRTSPFAPIPNEIGTVTGVIPANRFGPTRYEVRFDCPDVNNGCSYDFRAPELKVIEG